MSISARLARALLAVALTGSLVVGVPSTSSAAVTDSADRSPSDNQVTLITGDRLTIAEDGQVVVEHNPNRSGVRFTNYRRDGHTYVLPSDALPALTAGDLDHELFNVTALLASGHGTNGGGLPIIVTYAPTGEASTRGYLAAGGATVGRELSSVDSIAARTDHDTTSDLWHELTTAAPQGRALRPAVDRVWLDRLRKTTLDTSVPQVGAPAAWAAGYDGTGATVAVLDTGIDATHPDLTGAVAAAQNFTTEPDARDLNGHGTHVASTIAGTGAASQGANRGVASGATLLNGKVCEASGYCPDSAIIAGMEWAVAQGADVVNLSVGGPDRPGVDPLEQAVNELTASSGTLFVIAAGNSGADEAIGSPGSADAALTVGAVDGSNNLANFSSRGPRPEDAALKPDITAPGVDITAARSSTAPIGTPGAPYVDNSGTSMATPHVAGAAAILAQRHPTWSPTQIKAALMGSAVRNPTLGAFAQGAGRLDVARSVQQPVVADPPSLSLGRQQWPHGDDPVLTKTITYRNHGTSPLSLNLALATSGPGGGAAPAGMFALSASSVQVPAGGQASVQLTTDTRVTAPDGLYTGYLTATGPSVLVSTPFAVDRAEESYDLTLQHLDRAGNPTTAYFGLVQSADGSRVWIVGGPGPVTVPRVPAGTYLVTSAVYGGGPAGPETTVLAAPRVEMNQARSLVMDARLAQPVSVSVPDPQASVVMTEIGVQMNGSGESAYYTQRVGSGTTYIGQLGSQYVWGSFSKVGFTLARPGPGGGSFNSPRVYHLAWFTDQRLPTGFNRTVASADLATVETHYAGHIPGTVGTKAAYAHPGGTLYGTQVGHVAGVGLSFSLPSSRTEVYNTDGGIRWHSAFLESTYQFGPGINYLNSGVKTYTGGVTSQETWNRPVYGPAFTSSIYDDNWVTRTGNVITASVPLFGDADGHAGLPDPATSSGTLVLKRNGVTIGELAYPAYEWRRFTVPAGNATYRLEATVERTAPVTLSTKVSAAWTFISDTVSPTAKLRLPLWAVRFSPNLDAQSTAPAGGTFVIPVSASAQPASATSNLRSLTVDYSVNDGATWQSATVSATNGVGTATVTHPNTTGFVSLRARAEDWAGNVVEQTVTRAYRIAPA
ncbi:S8 family serine peptidase [Micromonospora sp. KC723]|uniref:S8 family serine peptidase n=1 Tax=Micromonospora sp. KC723 TaxID=2530381 RepID=UPI0010540AB1|nr:S8 family serine peptidase [Micromonospora sp. KC723]TDB76157.1 peptidase S8 [Micromonospora sp. KC723]